MLDKLICPKCKFKLLMEKACDFFKCSRCHFAGEVVNEIPLFIAQEKTKFTKGITESSFKTPGFYKKFVEFKRLIYKDKQLSTIDDYVFQKNVLDIGCGPSLQFDHLEYTPNKAKSLTAIDVSLPFVKSVKKENPDSKYSFAVASISEIPFEDKTFDTSIVSFVIHHVAENPMKVLNELKRVTKKNIIIFDHLKSDNFFKRFVQTTYWNIFDGGCHYQTKDEWNEVLKSFEVVKYLQTGALFGHVIKLVLKVN